MAMPYFAEYRWVGFKDMRSLHLIQRASGQAAAGRAPIPLFDANVAIWSMALAICATFVAFSAIVLYNMRASTLREVEADLSRYSMTLAEQADRSFKSVDLVTLSIAEFIKTLDLRTQDSLTQRLGQRDVHDLIVQKMSGLPQLDAITVINADGKLLNFSRYWPIPNVNVSDRDYYKALKSDPNGKTFLSEPVENRGTGSWTIYLARRLNGPSGEFFGLVLGAMTLQYFEDFYRLTAPSDASAVSLMRNDGTMLARSPKTEQVGKKFPEAASLVSNDKAGTARSSSPIDGIMRIKAAQSLRNFPLFILATESEDGALRDWTNIAIVLTGLCAGAVLITLVSTVFVSRWWRQQIQLHTTLEEMAHVERARAEAEAALLRERSQLAEEANHAKSAFLAVMSHEMRTPLNGVIGALDLLQRTPLVGEQAQFVESALMSSEALLAQISDVLDFSKMEAGKLELECCAVDLRHLTSSLLGIVGSQASKRGNKLIVSVAETIPTRITADPVRLRQILLNFLSNAVKFTRDGEVHLEIAIDGEVAEASNLEFSVRDTGEGIPQDRISSLFKEFSMVDSTYARNAGGTGLGLAICKRLVTVMGGEIGVDSEPGKGSRFWFRIPLSVATEDTSNVPAEAPTLDELPQGPVRSLSILLVDDNGTNRMVASRMLEASGHRVLTAVDGREALAAAREQIFDVIFMDISMPVMDGLEATRRIRVLPDPFNCVPIVALTANALAGDRAQFLAAGMNDYLTKPVRRAALDGVLSKIARDSVDETVVGASDRVDHPEGSQRSHRVAEAVIDVTELSNLANETSSEIVQTVIATFNNELQGRVEELLAATGSHSLHEVERLAHAIAGSAASVGAIKLRGLAKRIEADGKANEFQSALARSQQIGAVAAETLEELRAFSAQLDHRAA